MGTFGSIERYPGSRESINGDLIREIKEVKVEERIRWIKNVKRVKVG